MQITEPCSKKSIDEGEESERLTCHRMHATRAIAIAAATLAAASVAVALTPSKHAGLLLGPPAMATGCGLLAIWIAVRVSIPGGQLTGLGFVFHCCGTCASALGVVASERRLRRATLARQLGEDVQCQRAGHAEGRMPPGRGAAAATAHEASKDPEGFPIGIDESKILSSV